MKTLKIRVNEPEIMVLYLWCGHQMLRLPNRILGFVYQRNKNKGKIYALQKFNSILPLPWVPSEVGVGPID
jgi:hypothetical protein